ncbi:MAG TPA: hypothetical protein VG448_08270 [Solirubrobacterales bacterium]|nr:hypothetical protein [Solirubrobacterales bacterium]
MSGLRILFSGMVAGDPEQGGASWSILQYLLGFRDLGHEVRLVEPVDRLDPPVVSYFEQLVQDFGLEGEAALLVRGSRETAGAPYKELTAWAAEADVLFNVSGMLRDDELVGPPPLRVFLDLDPAFNQPWHAEGIEMGFDLHNRFATVGLALGEPECPVPTCGREWIKTLPPVFLPRWEFATAPGTAWTTVGNWRGYGSVEWKGRRYGQKAHSLRKLLALPRLTSERLEPALAIHPEETEDLAALREHGWQLADPVAVAGTPGRYTEFVRGSRGELGIAKEGYVESRCGWFSDRSACYLASGRPVVAQDTGFPRHLPTGEGLLAFSTAEEAAAAIDTVSADYDRHARAARTLAEDLLDSRTVLPRLLDRVASTPADSAANPIQSADTVS